MQKVSATDNISKAILEDKRCFAILESEREASLTWSVLRTMEEDTSRRNDFSFGSPFDSYENEEVDKPEAEQWMRWRLKFLRKLERREGQPVKVR